MKNNKGSQKPKKSVNQSIVKVCWIFIFFIMLIVKKGIMTFFFFLQAKLKAGKDNTSIDKKQKKNLKRPLKDAKKGFNITVLDTLCHSASFHSTNSQREGRQLEDNFGSYTQETLIDITQIIHMNTSEAKNDKNNVPEKPSTSHSLNQTVEQLLSQKVVDYHPLPHNEDNFLYANTKDFNAVQPYPQSVEKVCCLESEDQALFEQPLPQILASEYSVSDLKSTSNDVLSSLSSQEHLSSFVPYKSDKVGRHKVVECGMTEEGNQLKLVVEPEYGDKSVKRECILRDLW